MVKTSPSNAGCASSTSDREDKIPHAFGAKKPKQNRNSIVTNSIETLKMIHIRTKSLFLKKKKSPKIGTVSQMYLVIRMYVVIIINMV